MKKLFIVIIAGVLFTACSKPESKPEEAMAATPVVAAAVAPVVYGDSMLIDRAKQALEGMTSGNIDAFTADYADNCVYQWNYGDSIVSKTAIADYWKDRRTNVIDKVAFDAQIWLPIVVNNKNGTTDTWLLLWTEVTATYKTGKSMKQGMHMDFHYNQDKKIDRVYHYLDRAPIMAATKK